MEKLMKQLLSLIRPRKVRNKFFMFMILLSIPPLFILGFISYNIAGNTLVANQVQSTQEHLKTSSEVADLLFQNIIKMERLISWNGHIRKELVESAEIGGSKVIGEETKLHLKNLVSSYLIDTQDIASICLFDKDFNSVCYGDSNSYGILNQNIRHHYISVTNWYIDSIKANGKPIFKNYNVLTNDDKTFSSIKLLKDPQSLFEEKVMGLLVVNIKKTMFSKVFNERNDANFVVLDTNSDNSIPIYTYPETFANEIRKSHNKTLLFNGFVQEDYIINSYENMTTGWDLVLLIKEKNLIQESNKIRFFTSAIALLIAILALLLSFFLSGRLTKPLHQLKSLVTGGAKEIYNVEVSADKDEIGTISETFTQMNAKTKELSIRLIRSELKEKEAELRALQAQIKPHFLYNTLDSIYWMATLQNNPEIARMVFSLSKSFKLSLNNGNELIPVSKELEHIDHYITILNLRYNGRFKYIEEVDQELMQIEILKLLIQPLVENAIYHGLEPKEGEGTIKVIGKLKDNLITFIVEDNGVGINGINKINKGYGLNNVRERLALFYGPTSRCLISTELNKGTKVELRFFLNKEENLSC